jgi:hypothetical protein
VLVLHVAALERFRQDVGRDHRVLYGVVDADAADGRHDVRRVADEQEAGP